MLVESRVVESRPPSRAAQDLEIMALRPWEWPWWRTTPARSVILIWIVLIHLTAVAGLILYPFPGWPIFLSALGLTWLGGLGTTVAYHRTIAHRSLRLKSGLRSILIFFAMLNGSGAPLSWAASHRQHHAYVDGDGDISSPRHGGFWWAHLRWLWQTGTADATHFCRDLDRSSYRIWGVIQPVILTFSFFGGLYFGYAAFFWLGSIRLVFALHAQCFVNSVCHMEPDLAAGEDSSRNVGWLGFVQFFHGENWHRNHHAHPGLARLGWSWRQPDAGYVAIWLFERMGLATDVRRLRSV